MGPWWTQFLPNLLFKFKFKLLFKFQQVHRPLLALILLSVAGNLVDSFFPQLLSCIPKQLSFIPQHLIPQTKLIAGAHTLLACGSVAAAIIMLSNLKSSFCKDVAMEVGAV